MLEARSAVDRCDGRIDLRPTAIKRNERPSVEEMVVLWAEDFATKRIEKNASTRYALEVLVQNEVATFRRAHSGVLLGVVLRQPNRVNGDGGQGSSRSVEVITKGEAAAASTANFAVFFRRVFLHEGHGKHALKF